MNGTNETKGLLIDYLETNREKRLLISLNKAFFKSSSGQSKVNRSIYDE